MWIRIVVQVPWPSLNNHLIHHIRIQDRIQLPGVVSNGRKVKVWYCINTIQKVFRYRMNILRVCNLDRQVKQRYYPLTAELVFHSWSGQVIVFETCPVGVCPDNGGWCWSQLARRRSIEGPEDDGSIPFIIPGKSRNRCCGNENSFVPLQEFFEILVKRLNIDPLCISTRS